MKGVFGTCVFCLLAQAVFSISHRTTLIWTEKGQWGAVKISGVAGDPEDWFKNGSVVLRGGSAPLDFFSRIMSHRVALAFRYSTKQLFFSDRGFKSISQLKLKVVHGDHYSYNASIETVYSGTSVLVYGMAVDWLSGSLYWTDARYNWITVGSTTKYRIFRHLVVTGLDMPMGIAVYPKKGLMFWSDWGVQPKIERSNLVGTDRKVLLTIGLRRPQGLTIDYDENRLYWVDDETDTVEMSDLDGGQRNSFNAKEPGHYEHSLFGITVFEDFVFVTDQLSKDVQAYRKSSKQYIGRFILDRSVPYDVMMYSGSRQEEMDNAECKTMGCQHLCISGAGGHGMCMCSQDFELQADNKTCKRNLLTMQPNYIYAVGNGICKTRINAPDTNQDSILQHLQCFEKEVGHVRALGFHSYAELLFYSDVDTGTIHRKRMAEADEDAQVIVVQTGYVTGIAVDWIVGHLYWTDELYGHIMVSDLTGRYQHVILAGLNKPRGIEVDPAAGLLYWCAEGAIYRSAMDGTAARRFISQDVHSPAGMVLDITSKRLYWTDVDHIESVSVTDNSNRRRHFSIPSDSSDTLNDVTIYQDYMAWTTTSNMVYFGYKDSHNSLRVVKHENTTAVYDVVAYGTHLQPIIEGPCDNENGDCSQLCFPNRTANGTKTRICGCAFPFYLDKDGKTCLSDFDNKGSYFLLFVDPYRKQAYQHDAKARDGQLRGIILQSAAFPDRIEYDERDNKIYWFDPTENVISRESMDGKGKEVFHSLPPGHTLGSMVLHSRSRQLFYTDPASTDIIAVSLDKNETRKFHSGNILPGSLAVDNHNGRIFWAENTSQICTIFHRNIDSDAAKVTQAKVSVVTHDNITGLAVDPDGKYLIWWTFAHVKGTYLNESTSNVAAVIRSDEDNYTSAAVVDRWLYFTTWTSKTVLSINLLHPANVTKLSTNLSRITDIRAYRETQRPSIAPTASRTRPTTASPITYPVVVKTASSLGGQSKPEPSLTMFGGLAAGLVGLMLLIMLLACVVMRRHRRKRNIPSPPPVVYASPAHDNPTYMSRDEVRAQAVSLGGATAARSLPMSPAEKVPIEEESEEKCHDSSCDGANGACATSDIAMSAMDTGDVAVYMEITDTHREGDCAKLVEKTRET